MLFSNINSFFNTVICNCDLKNSYKEKQKQLYFKINFKNYLKVTHSFKTSSLSSFDHLKLASAILIALELLC